MSLLSCQGYLRRFETHFQHRRENPCQSWSTLGMPNTIWMSLNQLQDLQPLHHLQSVVLVRPHLPCRGHPHAALCAGQSSMMLRCPQTYTRFWHQTPSPSWALKTKLSKLANYWLEVCGPKFVVGKVFLKIAFLPSFLSCYSHSLRNNPGKLQRASWRCPVVIPWAWLQAPTMTFGLWIPLLQRWIWKQWNCLDWALESMFRRLQVWIATQIALKHNHETKAESHSTLSTSKCLPSVPQVLDKKFSDPSVKCQI